MTPQKRPSILGMKRARAASAVLGALAAATQDGDKAAAKLHTLAPAEHRCRSTFGR